MSWRTFSSSDGKTWALIRWQESWCTSRTHLLELASRRRWRRNIITMKIYFLLIKFLESALKCELKSWMCVYFIFIKFIVKKSLFCLFLEILKRNSLHLGISGKFQKIMKTWFFLDIFVENTVWMCCLCIGVFVQLLFFFAVSYTTLPNTVI